MFSWSRWVLTLLGFISFLLGCGGGLPVSSPEKTSLQQLTHEPSQDFYADWSPDGQKIAFISDRSGSWNIWVIRLDGSHPQALTADHQATSPTWNPDGTMIAYATDRESGMRFWTDLWTMKSDGSFQKPLGQTPTLKDLVPSWSPDGKYIAFLRMDMTAVPAWRIIRLDMESKQFHEIASDKILFSRLTWSPNGKEIAFVSDRSGKPELWIMDRDGKETRPITHDGAEKKHPDWSPDGKWIVFASKRAGNFNLWLIHPDGTGLKRLTRSPATDTLPDWSPDGKKIAFTSDRSGNQDIWLMSINNQSYGQR